MKNIALCIWICLGLIATPVYAGAQQERMKSCNKEAKEKALSGNDRKAFMKTCLSGKSASTTEKKAAATAKK